MTKRFEPERVKNCFGEFLAHLRGVGRVKSDRRIRKYEIHLVNLTRWARKPLQKLTAHELNQLLTVLNKRKYTAWTTHDYLISLRRYLRFMGREDLAATIKVSTPAITKIDERNVLTVSDVHAVMNRATSIVYRTAPWLLFDFGPRTCEFCALNVGDVVFDGPYLYIKIRGVPGARKNEYVPRDVPTKRDDTIELMRRYLEWHPHRNDPNAPLWLNEIGTRLHTRTLWKYLIQLAKAAGITKRAAGKYYRLASRSVLYPELSESAAETRYGWCRGSRMHQVYNQSGRDALRRELDKITPKSVSAEVAVKTEAILEQLRYSPELRYLIEAQLGIIDAGTDWDSDRQIVSMKAAESTSPQPRAPWSGSARNNQIPSSSHSNARPAALPRQAGPSDHLKPSAGGLPPLASGRRQQRRNRTP